MGRIAVVMVVVACLALPEFALASVRATSFTRAVHAGDYASLTVRVSPRARCTIEVIYDTVVSHARGLGAKTGTAMSWRWRVGTSTHPGRWPVIVRCGKSGTARLLLRVAPH
jgi:micrococcal nuclease